MKALLTRLVDSVGLVLAAFALGCFLGRAEGRHLGRKDALARAMQQADKAVDEIKRKLKDQEDVANDARKNEETARADAVAARTVSDRLRDRLAELISRSDHPASSGDCALGERAGVLLADMPERADARAAELADYADKARIAGQAYERAYDVLTTK